MPDNKRNTIIFKHKKEADESIHWKIIKHKLNRHKKSPCFPKNMQGQHIVVLTSCHPQTPSLKPFPPPLLFSAILFLRLGQISVPISSGKDVQGKKWYWVGRSAVLTEVYWNL